jgi:hypothetical protein
MVDPLEPRRRSIDQLVLCVIIVFVLSISAAAQTQQLLVGTQNIQASLDSNNSAMAEAFPVWATSSGQINSLSLYLDRSSTAATVGVGLYSSYDGHPLRLLSQSVIPQPVPGQWNSVSIRAVQVTKGREYWVAVLGLNGQIEFRDTYCYNAYDGTSRHGQYGGSETSRQANLTSLPTTWWTGSQYSTCAISMFGSAGTPSNVSLTVSPTAASLQAGQQTQFTATVSGTTNTAVTWRASGGTVTSAGQYTAPSSAGTYTVTATSAADSSKSASAAVTVTQPIQVSISVSPSTASLQSGGQQQFSATVSGTTNTAVTWTASGGTVSSGGQYTAPSSAGTYTVTATSAADSSKSASAVVTVTQPVQVSISVSPTTANLQTGGQQQFSTAVSGTTNTAVTWKASGGTVTSGGQYTAPSSAGTYTVTATSVADSSKSASAVVTVSQPIQVSISVSPTTASLQTGGQQQFSAYLSGTSNTAVTWSASGGTVTTNGLYGAPSAAGTYTVTAVSAADSTKSASAIVTVSAPQPISVSISPTTVAMPEKWTQQFSASVSGSANTSVTWAIAKGTGTISQSGVYTAPQAVETDVVTVTSQADNTKSASATITVAAPHKVTLTWAASSTSGVSYNVYRGTISGGPYALLASGVASTSYTDTNVQSGTTYYYVTKAVDSSGQSAYSNEAQVVIPIP